MEMKKQEFSCLFVVLFFVIVDFVFSGLKVRVWMYEPDRSLQFSSP